MDEWGEISADSQFVDPRVPTHLADQLNYLRTFIRNVWKQLGISTTDTRSKLKIRLEKGNSQKNFSRRSQVTLSRLRIGHANITNSYLLTGPQRPFCEYCHVRLTIEHLLVTCPTHKYAKLNINQEEEECVRNTYLYLTACVPLVLQSTMYMNAYQIKCRL